MENIKPNLYDTGDVSSLYKLSAWYPILYGLSVYYCTCTWYACLVHVHFLTRKTSHVSIKHSSYNFLS